MAAKNFIHLENGVRKVHSFDPDSLGGGGGGSSTESFAAGRNESGATLTKGSPVYYDSYDVTDTENLLELASSSAASTANVVGLMAADLANNTTDAEAIQTYGPLSGLDTSAFAFDDPVYVSPTAGELQNYPGAFNKKVGFVTYVHASDGIIFLQPEGNIWELGSGRHDGALWTRTLDSDESEVVVPHSVIDWERYCEFELLCHKTTGTTDGAHLRMYFQDDGTDITGTYSVGYRYARLGLSSSGGFGANYTNYGQFATWGGGNLTANSEGYRRMKITLHKPDGVKNEITYRYRLSDTTPTPYDMSGGIMLGSATEYNGIRLAMSSGNLTSGMELCLFGKKR